MSATLKQTQRHRSKANNALLRAAGRKQFNRYSQLVDAGAKVVASDRYGKLLRQELDGDEPIVMVQVVNSTPEPDGHFKDYFIRVPPEIQTAHEAVAWSFGKTTKEYAPLIET